MQLLPWIVKNMIGESEKNTASDVRQPSEAELRVQRSLMRLDIPDWYTNKVRPSPKILRDRRPIECRPAPWKDTTRRHARVKKSLESALKSAARDDVQSLDFIELPIGPTSHISKTFPKMSPSRKIQNINIVFPPIEKSARSSAEAAKSVEAKKSVEISESNGSSESEKLTEPEKSDSQSNQTATLAAPDKSAEATRYEEEQSTIFRETDFPVGSTDSIVTMSAFTPQKMSSLKNQTRSVTTSTPLRPEIYEPHLESRLASESYACREKMFASAMKRDDSRLETCTESSLDETLASMTEQLFASPNKSMAMERIIKFEKKNKAKPTKKGLVEEIIKELTSKGKSKVNTTCTSPISKSFVKKLVQALESDPGSEIDTDLDGKSMTVSSNDNIAEISEISRCSAFEIFRQKLEAQCIAEQTEHKAYTDEHNVHWIPIRMPKMPRTSSVKSIASKIAALGLEVDDKTKQKPPISKKNLPISKKNLPISEKSASPRSGKPIGSALADRTRGSPRARTDFDWGKTFCKETPKLPRIEEAVVIDSGYSDGSANVSPGSSPETDKNWYRDIETKGWVSEIGDDFAESCLREVESNCGIPMQKQRVTAV